MRSASSPTARNAQNASGSSALLWPIHHRGPHRRKERGRGRAFGCDGLDAVLLADVQAARRSSQEWIARATWAVARGEAIIAGARDPDAPVEGDRP